MKPKRKKVAKQVSSLLREARKKMGIPQMELAKRMGAYISHVNRNERGKSLPSLDFIARYVEALGLRAILRFEDGEGNVVVEGRVGGDGDVEENG